ncbi:AAA-ATPase, partial [Cucurbita argyrosperma subsp. argyrosperma]
MAAMSVMELWTQYFRYHLRRSMDRHAHKLIGSLYPYITNTFPQYTGERLRRSEAFTAIKNYLASRSSVQAKRLRAEAVKDS